MLTGLVLAYLAVTTTSLPTFPRALSDFSKSPREKGVDLDAPSTQSKFSVPRFPNPWLRCSASCLPLRKGDRTSGGPQLQRSTTQIAREKASGNIGNGVPTSTQRPNTVQKSTGLAGRAEDVISHPSMLDPGPTILFHGIPGQYGNTDNVQYFPSTYTWKTGDHGGTIGMEEGDLHSCDTGNCDGSIYLTDSVLAAAQYGCYSNPGPSPDPETTKVAVIQYEWTPPGGLTHKRYEDLPSRNEMTQDCGTHDVLEAPMNSPCDVHLTHLFYQYAITREAVAEKYLIPKKKYWFNCAETALLRKIEVGLEWTSSTPKSNYQDPLKAADFARSQGAHSEFEPFVDSLKPLKKEEM